jgi:ABC-type uncharacterized transport system permease subunit
MSEMLASALRMSTPVLFAALAGMWSERSGIVNIGLEGMMIIGSFWGAYGSYAHGPIWGVVFGAMAGMLLALIHAVATVNYRINQIVSGVALNILAYGLTRFLCIKIFHQATASEATNRMTAISIPILDRVEALRPLVTGVSPVILLGLALVPVSWYVLNRTVFGLRLRSSGENPLAADTLGVNVFAMRYAGVLIGGALAGIGGMYLSVEHTGMYVEGMTQGKGFIGLAAMIFGNWTAGGALWAALLFGTAEAASFRAVSAAIPYQFIKMIPYALTLGVLAGVVRRAVPPAAAGEPYERGGE